MPGIPPRLTRVAALLFVILCAGWYVRDSFAHIPDSGPSDFRWYYLAAQHVARGESPYLAAGYLYPPFLACLMTPLAALDYVPARWVCFLFSHACLLTAAWLTWRHLGSDWTAGCVVALVWALGGAAGESLALGQTGPLLTLLLAVACTSTGWPQTASIGIGVAVKLIPGVLCVALALKRDWRSLLATLCWAALLLVTPWVFVAGLAGPRAPVRQDYLAGTPAVLSWSLPSVALRLSEPPAPDGRLPKDWLEGNTLQSLRLPRGRLLLSIGVALAVFGAGCLALAAAARGRLSPKQFPLAAAAIVALALAAAPVCWTHYQVMQYPGVALLLGGIARGRRWRLFAAALTLAAFLYPIPVAVLRAYYAHLGGWPNSLAVMYFWTSVSPMASLALFGLMVRRLITM